MARHVNLDAVCHYLHHAPVASLDGVVNAVEGKCKELGIEHSKKKFKAVKSDVPRSSNVRGVIEFVASVTKPEKPSGPGDKASPEHKAAHERGKANLEKNYAEAKRKFDEDCDALQTIQAVLRYRVRGADYQVDENKVDA